MTEKLEGPLTFRLTEVCWPVFQFLTDFGRRVQHGMPQDFKQVRFDAVTALRDAEEIAAGDPSSEKLWRQRVKTMMVYLLDYVLTETSWTGQEAWRLGPFETDPEMLGHEAVRGGSAFFEDCDQIQGEFELAERRDLSEKENLAELLGLYFICLSLGFKGQYQDRPQELADYTRRLFTRLPAHASTRAREMFPDSYRHNREVKVSYNLGMSLTVMVTIFVVIVVLAGVTFHIAWKSAVGDIATAAEQVENGTYFEVGTTESAGESGG
jgi:type IV/VI secretion system ImpK/VasF family protein